MRKIILFVSCFLFSIIIFLFFLIRTTTYSIVELWDYPENEKELVEYYDNIFIGKINKRERIIIPDDFKIFDRGDFAISQYSFELIYQFKGELSNDSYIDFMGVKSLFLNEIRNINDVFLENGSYYLFFANDYLDDNSDVKRYLLEANFQKIKLNDYDTSKLYTEQNDDIIETINSHIKYI